MFWRYSILFLKKHPQYIFRTELRPDFADDLNAVDSNATELLIQGKTKNLQRLKLFLNLQKLWIYTVNQSQFDTILRLVSPKMLHIYEMRVEDLSNLECLKELVVLALEWNTKAHKLWNISKNQNLKSLSIKDFSKLNDIERLEQATRMELLDLSGSDSTSLKLKNLGSLKQLINLKFLGLSNIKVEDESLQPITELKELRDLLISNQFPTEEYAKLSVALPNTKSDKFEAYVHISPIGDKDIMVVGKRKPLLNSNSKSDVKRLQKYQEQFKEYQDKYKM
jgi:hypothetical protein